MTINFFTSMLGIMNVVKSASMISTLGLLGSGAGFVGGLIMFVAAMIVNYPGPSTND